MYIQKHHLNLLDLNNGYKLDIKNITAIALCIPGYIVSEKAVRSNNDNADIFQLLKENR